MPCPSQLSDHSTQATTDMSGRPTTTAGQWRRGCSSDVHEDLQPAATRDGRCGGTLGWVEGLVSGCLGPIPPPCSAVTGCVASCLWALDGVAIANVTRF